MNIPTPHFLLFSESDRKHSQGQWRFVLQSLDGSKQFEAEDVEPEARGERLELLAVVRGLEALPGPSRVTLVTPSRYVNRGLSYGLEEWRANDWQWEHFGQMVPVKNRDLWQRIDRALQYHDLHCRTWRFDLPQTEAEDARTALALRRAQTALLQTADGAGSRDAEGRVHQWFAAFQLWLGEKLQGQRLWWAQVVGHLLPRPRLE